MMKKMMKVMELLLMLLMMVALSQCSDVTEDIQSDLKFVVSQNTPLMMLVVLCGAGLVGILGALIHVARPPPIFTLRPATNHVDQHAGPPFKLFDRIDEFH